MGFRRSVSVFFLDFNMLFGHFGTLLGLSFGFLGGFIGDFPQGCFKKNESCLA